MIRAERYRYLAETSAKRWGAREGVTVPVPVVLALIMKESSGVPTAQYREKDGEFSRGLMMVKESTARGMGLADTQRLFDPATGIDYGVRYLAYLLRLFKGDTLRAISAYNGGKQSKTKPGTFTNQAYVTAVLKWLKALGQGTAYSGGAALLLPLLLLGAGIGAALHARRGRATAAWGRAA